MKKIVTTLLCVSLFFSACSLGQGQSNGGINMKNGTLPSFTVEPGIRLEHASNPAASIDENGGVYLYHNNTSEVDWAAELGSDQPVGYAEDGLNFELIAKSKTSDYYDPHKVQLADGTWRKYTGHGVSANPAYVDPLTGMVSSQSSEDGVNFTDDEGIRYEGDSSDNGLIGVTDFFVDSMGGIVMLYIGDMGGSDNIRRAYAQDTWNFVLEDNNFMGDINAGPHEVHVDPNTTALSNGYRLLLTMVRGENTVPQPGERKVGAIYGTLLDAEGYPVGEPQLLFNTSDVSEFNVWSLNDPVAVQLPDGRIRIYVATLLDDGSWAIISAISE